MTVRLDTGVRYRIMTAACALYAVKVHAVDTAAPRNLLAVGDGEIRQVLRERAMGAREFLSVTSPATLTGVSSSHATNKACADRGTRMVNLFCHESTEPAARDFLSAVDDMPDYYSYCPVQMWIVDRREVLIDGMVAGGGHRLLSLTSTRATTAAWRYWNEISAVAIPTSASRTAVANDRLSPRQLRIARLLANDMDDEAIARLLELSVRTVRYEVAAILRQLKVRSRFSAGFRIGSLVHPA